MWRLLLDRDVAPSHGLAVDDALTRTICANDQPILRLYSYSNCVLIGRFQHVGNEVHIDHCRKINIPINRRPTGGGAIIMGPNQLGVALVIPPSHLEQALNSAEFIRKYSNGIVDGLRNLGINASFEGKNDLLVSGRKIAGLGAYTAESGAKLFHASILIDLDLDYMLKVLKTSLEKMQDKGIAAIQNRITTIRRETGIQYDMDTVAQAISDGYGEKFGVELIESELTGEELSVAEKLREQQYESREWLYGEGCEVRDSVGHYRENTAAGLIDIRAIVAGETVKSVMVHGDFLTSDTAHLDLEGSLRWHQSSPAALHKTVEAAMARHEDSWNGMDCKTVAAGIVRAVEMAGTAVDNPDPGACFIRT